MGVFIWQTGFPCGGLALLQSMSDVTRILNAIRDGDRRPPEKAANQELEALPQEPRRSLGTRIMWGLVTVSRSDGAWKVGDRDWTTSFSAAA